MTRSMTVSSLRNIGIIAHVDAGKTTLTERILFYTGRIRKMGEVHHGTARMDHLREEQDKGITITAAAVQCHWREHTLNLIDTPGHVDFTIEVERSLRVLDGAVCVLDAVAGVEPQTETVWRQADRHGVPRIVFVNKLDRAGARFEHCVAMVEERLGARPLVLTLPIGSERGFVGVVDVLRRRALVWDQDEDGTDYSVRAIPKDLEALTEQAHRALREACADVEDELVEAVLEGADISEEALLAALRRGTREGAFVPVLAGSAYKKRGVQPLLDAVVDLLPAPTDAGPVVAADGQARERSRSERLSALVFKVAWHSFGQLSFVRVYSGVLEKGMTVKSSRRPRGVRVGRLVRLFADHTSELESVGAGDIVAIIGGSYVTGETLADPAHPLALESVVAPATVVRLAIEPSTSKDRDKMGRALRRLLIADPSLRLTADSETGQTLLGGMGQLHLEVTVARLRSEHGVAVTTGAPKVAYKATLRRSIEHELEYKKQTGGPGQYAHVVLRVAPAEPGAGLVFTDEIRGGVVPREYIPGVHEGVREAMDRGILGGHAVVDVAVTLLDGSFHSNDSSEMAFKEAGRLAFVAAAKRADPVVLEPVVRLEVTTPSAPMGAVMGDLSSRRGQILAMNPGEALSVVTAEVPLAETFGYATRLSSLTHGRGSHAMELSRYAPVPDAVAARLLESA